jgi:ABC-type multidrug transport system fused ATPase/permease subunit
MTLVPEVSADGGGRWHPDRRPAWRLLLEYLWPHRWTVLGGGVLGFAGGLAALSEPMLAKLVVNSIGGRRSLLGPVALLGLLLVGGAMLNAAGSYLLGRTAESVVLTARRQLTRHLLCLRVGVMDRLQPGDLLSRVVSDTTLLRSVSASALVQSINAGFLLVASVVMMALLDRVLLGTTVAVLALNAITLVVVVPRIRRAAERSQAALGGMSSLLERALGAFRTLKASGAEEREITSVGEAAGRAWRRGVEVAGWTALMEATAGLAVQLSFLAVLGIGGARVASGALPVSSLIAFLLYLLLLTEPITALVAGASQFQTGLAAIVRMRRVNELPAEREAEAPRTRAPDPSPPPSRPVSGPASATFDQVWFRYRFPEDSHWVHRGLTFELPPGAMTAVVGPSGGGKSTILALLERFYEPQAGTVAIDGRDVREWSLPELRATIGYVEQDAPVLAGTLRDNLCLAAPGVEEDRLAQVLALTRLEDLLARVPDRLDTPVGHHGVTLSGGERQRIAIARALLRQPRLLLLDEATSQLDAVNELAIRDVIAEVAGATTVLVIAHRLSTVISAHRIMVVESGRVRGAGTHDELIAANDLYRRLVESQLLVPTA